MGFPLLRLPLLALNAVTDFLDPIEVFNFSGTSKKCKRVLKSLRLHSLYAEVVYGDDASIYLHLPDRSIEYGLTTNPSSLPKRADGRVLPKFMKKLHLPIPPLELLQSFFEVFRHTLMVDIFIENQLNSKLVDFINSYPHASLPTIRINCHNPEELEYFLSNNQKDVQGLFQIIAEFDEISPKSLEILRSKEFLVLQIPAKWGELGLKNTCLSLMRV